MVHRLLAEEAAIPIARAFMAEYPGIEVLHNRMVGADIGKTVLAEAKAGAEIGDVFDRTNTVVSLAPAGMIEPYVSPNAADILDIYKDRSGLWAAQVLYFTTVGYNTKLVPVAEAPRTFGDLLDPPGRANSVGPPQVLRVAPVSSATCCSPWARPQDVNI